MYANCGRCTLGDRYDSRTELASTCMPYDISIQDVSMQYPHTHALEHIKAQAMPHVRKQNRSGSTHAILNGAHTCTCTDVRARVHAHTYAYAHVLKTCWLKRYRRGLRRHAMRWASLMSLRPLAARCEGILAASEGRIQSEFIIGQEALSIDLWSRLQRVKSRHGGVRMSELQLPVTSLLRPRSCSAT